MNQARTLVQQCAFNAGQAAALGIVLKALLAAHPKRDALVASIEADLDDLIVRHVPEDFVHGIQAARERYIAV